MENADIPYMVIAIRRMIIKNVPKPGFDKRKVPILRGTPGTIMFKKIKKKE